MAREYHAIFYTKTNFNTVRVECSCKWQSYGSTQQEAESEAAKHLIGLRAEPLMQELQKVFTHSETKDLETLKRIITEELKRRENADSNPDGRN